MAGKAIFPEMKERQRRPAMALKIMSGKGNPLSERYIVPTARLSDGLLSAEQESMRIC
jgi:hypothetical protein